MLNLPRGLFWAAPALVSLVVGYCCVYSNHIGEQLFDSIFAESPESHNGMLLLQPANTEGMERMHFKQETVFELLEDRITLEQAVSRFWSLISNGTPESLETFRKAMPGTTDEARVIQQILSYANALANDRPNFAAALERLRTAALAGDNLFDVLMDAVRCCSLGEITHTLFEVGGRPRREPTAHRLAGAVVRRTVLCLDRESTVDRDPWAMDLRREQGGLTRDLLQILMPRDHPPTVALVPVHRVVLA